MTATQAAHLIEQFAAQCPLAIWILDSRGVAVFANKKLHELFGVAESPSGAVGMNVLKLPGIEKLGLGKYRDKLLEGESVATTTEIEDPSAIGGEEFRIGRKEPLVLRSIAYALKSSTQTIEHFVVFLEDATQTRSHHAALKEQTHDIQTFLRSKEARGEKLEKLKMEADDIRRQIKELGYEPEF